MSKMEQFTKQVGIQVPIICGPMYPCTNPELVAAVSEAGGIGIVQPVSMVYAHKHDFRQGLRLIRRLTNKPFGVNILVEKSVKAYEDRMRRWADIALEEGVTFFVTALGNPKWLVDLAHANHAIVYHDVPERKFALKALEAGVDGLICLNNGAGGHTGYQSSEQLIEELGDLDCPLICAGGIGNEQDYLRALDLGYAGVQMGTAFIATEECNTHLDYKQAIVRSTEQDIMVTDKISGIPCSVIRTPTLEKLELKQEPWFTRILKNTKVKDWMKLLKRLRYVQRLKRSALEGVSYQDIFQAGKSASGVHSIEPAGQLIQRFAKARSQTV